MKKQRNRSPNVLNRRQPREQRAESNEDMTDAGVGGGAAEIDSFQEREKRVESAN